MKRTFGFITDTSTAQHLGNGSDSSIYRRCQAAKDTDVYRVRGSVAEWARASIIKVWIQTRINSGVFPDMCVIGTMMQASSVTPRMIEGKIEDLRFPDAVLSIKWGLRQNLPEIKAKLLFEW